MKGRKPLPTQLKILNGNPGKRPLNSKEPKPRATCPECPSWLDDEAKAKWSLLAPELSGSGVLTSVDGDTLAAYCQAWAEFRQATETLKSDGRYISTGLGGLKSHPAVSQQRTSLQALQRFAALLGLDPSSRSRLQVPSGQQETNQWEGLLA